MVKLYKKTITVVTGPLTNLVIANRPIYGVVDKKDYVYYFMPIHGACVYATGTLSSIYQFEECSWLEILITMGLSQCQVMQLIDDYKKV